MVLFHTFNNAKTEKDLGDLIISGLEEFEDKKRNGRLYVSDSVICERKGMLTSTQDTIKVSDGIKQFFVEQGKTAESVSLKGLNNSGVLLFADYKLPDVGLDIGGKVDGIVYYKNKIYVLEVKQVGDLPTSPHKEHEAQAVYYSAILGLPAILFYLDRKIQGFNTGLLRKEFLLNTSYENRYKFTERTVRADLYVKNKLIPNKPEYMKKSWCNDCHCKFYSKCWGDDSDYAVWLEKGYNFSSYEKDIDIQKESVKITDMLLNPVTMKDRNRGVLKFLSEHGRDVAKKLLSGSWDGFYE